MRSSFEALVTEKALHFVSTLRGEETFDWIAEGRHEVDIPLKNVCAKVTARLSDEIDQIVNMLGISKRRFLEAAFIDAVRRAREIMEIEGVFEVVEENLLDDVGGEAA